MTAHEMSDQLFDSIRRIDDRPAMHTESRYAFLNRASGDRWALVRDALEGFYADYARAGDSDLRQRFRSGDDRQHISAWWELYLFVLLRRSGYELTLHPSLPASGGRPDFLVVSSSETFYVEATVVFSGVEPFESGADPVRDAWILDLTNEAYNPNFLVGLEIVRHGMQRPAARELVPRIERWLNGLDPDAVTERIATGERPPWLAVSLRDWVLEYEAFPQSAEFRGLPGRLLGTYGGEGGLVKVDEALRTALRRKARKYQDLSAPLVLAAMMNSPFSDENAAEKALFGPTAVTFHEGHPESVRWVRLRDGLWVRRSRPAARHVSAAVISQSIEPWTVSERLPRVWLNPWAHHAFTGLNGLPMGTSDATGAIQYTQGSMAASDIFEVLRGG